MNLSSLLLVLSLLWSLVEVHSQTAPYVSFMGQTLANHSYVDLSLVGNDFSSSDRVQCHTDLQLCCNSAHGIYRGDWYFPNETRLLFRGGSDIYENRTAQGVYLHRNSATSPTGLYRCDIATNAVHHDTDISVRATVYVGLYSTSGGGVTISGGVRVTVDSDLDGGSPQFTLTCISTGGPATTVTWTRDSTTVTEGNETALNDPVTANYTHTLTGNTAGIYTCTVANNKPSSDSASITVQGVSPPTGVVAVQDGATSIRVSWTPPSPLGATTGYTISYSGGGSSDSVTVDGGSTNSHPLMTGLTNGQTYTIFIAGTSTGLPSAPVEAMAVGLVPFSAAVLNTSPAVTATAITISGSVPSGSVVTGFLVEWQRDMGVGCSNKNQDTITRTGGFTSYEITGLEPGNRYTITVRVRNAAGNGPVSNAVSATTSEAAPTGAPASVIAGTITASSATIHWEEVPCEDRNGEITGYSVAARNSGGDNVGSASVGGDARQATVSGLSPSTTYTVSVAARNSAGTGPINTVAIETQGPSPPSNVAAVQNGATTVLVSWTPPSPLGATTGYTISYSGGGSSDSVTVDGGSTNSHTLTGLQNGLTYTISIASTFQNTAGDAVTIQITLIPAPGQVSVAVSSIAATSISLSWSVASGQVASSEVVWRETDRGTESSSGSLPGTSYTIDQLDTSTIYTIRIRASNLGGTTESSPIFVSTASEACQAESVDATCPDAACPECASSETDNTAAIIGGVVAVALILALTVIVIVVLVLRSRRGNYSTTKTSGSADVPATTSQALELSKFSEPTYADPDKFQTTSNEAYNVVRQTGRTTEVEYEAPQDLPPPTSSQPTTTAAGDYEPV